MGKARLTSRDVVPRDSVTYRSTYRRRSWHRRAIMEEFIRRRAAACARNTAVGIAGLNRSVAYKLAQVFADATFIIKLLHISHTHRLSSSAGNRLYRHSKVLSHCNTSRCLHRLFQSSSRIFYAYLFSFSVLCYFFGAMPCIIAAYAVMRCLCVCPSVVDHVKTNQRIFKIFSQSGSPTILVFPYQTSWHYSDPPPYKERRMQGGMKKITIFDQYLALSTK